jgi:hypothetical protein
MNNPLLNPSEQAHIDSIRAIQHSPDMPATGQPTNAWEAFTAFLAKVDYGRVFRVLSGFIGLVAVGYLTYVLKVYIELDGLGALGSIGHYVMGLFFFYLLLITGEKYQTWNFMFLMGLFGIVATF